MAFATRDYDDWIPLAEGGEGEVFRARQKSLDRFVAIKRLKLPLIGGEKEAARFETQAKLAAGLSHPGLVPVIEYGQEGRFYNLVMEYVRGVDLGRLVEGGLDVPFGLRCRFARHMAEAVEYLQGRGVLHRDLKPENFHVDFAGRVKLLDLGLARAAIRPVTDAGGKSLRGTLAYLPPELLQGGDTYDAASERYVLALVVLELLLGRRVFNGQRADAVLVAIQSGPADAHWKELPEALAPSLRPFFAANRGLRPGDFTALKAALTVEEKAAGPADALRAPLAAFLRACERDWLWAESLRRENLGQLEEAFRRTREILETDAGDSEASRRLADLGGRMNQGTPNAAPRTGPNPRTGRRWAMVASSLAAAAVLGALFFSKSQKPAREDLGRALVEKENRLATLEASRKSAAAAAAPSLKLYGTLILKGIPPGVRILVDGDVKNPDFPLPLHEARHAIEVVDSAGRRLFYDSIRVSAGEPASFDFAKEFARARSRP